MDPLKLHLTLTVLLKPHPVERCPNRWASKFVAMFHENLVNRCTAPNVSKWPSKCPKRWKGRCVQRCLVKNATRCPDKFPSKFPKKSVSRWPNRCPNSSADKKRNRNATTSLGMYLARNATR